LDDRRDAPPKKPVVVQPEGANALWRLPSWFPELSEAHLSSLARYHSELLRFNARLNLISRNSERDADEGHFADCVKACQMILAAHDLNGREVYDIGSGNGLPGVVLAILSPGTSLQLVESDSRKCEFLKHLIHTLELSNCQVMNVRLETLQDEQLSMAISRGFASLTRALLAINRCFVKGGDFFHLKGSGWSSEIAELPSQLISVWTPSLLGEYSLPVSQARRAIVSTKKIKD
jgi:16S rRNA (guanine527-N7)-methyltransferase